MEQLEAEDNEDIANVGDPLVIAKGYGLHPHHSHEFTEQLWEQVEFQVRTQDSAFVGEVGIECRQQYLERNPLEQQFEVLRRFLTIAFRHQKLVSLHVVQRRVDVYARLVEMLQTLQAQFPASRVMVLLHSFSSSYETLQRLIAGCPLVRFVVGVSHLNCESKALSRLLEFVLETDYCEEAQNYGAMVRSLQAKFDANSRIAALQLRVLQFVFKAE